MSNDSPPAVHESAPHDVPVIDLSQAPGAGEAWDRPKWMIYAWAAAEQLVIYNPWQVSSGLRVRALRLFGAQVGDGVIIRPRTRIKFPWKLRIGDHAWIGEGVWIHNQDQVTIGHDAVVSQDTFITTGSHAHRKDMGLVTNPVNIADGAWITTRCVVTGGVTIGRSALVHPLTRVAEDVPANSIYGSNAPRVLGQRFRQSQEEVRT